MDRADAGVTVGYVLFLQCQARQFLFQGRRPFQKRLCLEGQVDRLGLLTIGFRCGFRNLGLRIRQLAVDELQAALRLGRTARNILVDINAGDGVQNARRALAVWVFTSNLRMDEFRVLSDTETALRRDPTAFDLSRRYTVKTRSACPSNLPTRSESPRPHPRCVAV